MGWQDSVFVSLSGMPATQQPQQHPSTVCPCPDLSAHLQLTLLTPTVMPTKSLCSSWLKGVPATTGFLPSPSWAPWWAPSCRLCLWFVSALLSILLLCLLSLAHRYMLQCADLSGVPMHWSGNFCWIIAVQIVETSRGETMWISHTTIYLMSLLSLDLTNYSFHH